MKTYKHILTALTGLALTGSFAQAAVILNVGPTLQDRFTGTSASLDFTTQTANNSLLLVATATKDVGTSGGTDSVSSLSFNGQSSFTQLIAASDTIRQFQIWALDLGNETGVNSTIDITMADTGESAFFAYQISNATLTGVKTNFGTYSTAPPTTFSSDLTAVDTGSFILDLALSNNNKVGLTPTGDTRTGSLSVSSTSDDPGAMSSYITNWAGGDATLGYDAENRGGMVSVAFAAIPEPSTFALVGLSALAAILGLRRRR